jgi:uncharacterized protein (DUF111 family)
MSAEMLVYAEEKLFEAGALDVFKTPIIMKKGRPAIKLSVLSTTELLETVKEVLFYETTAIGLRAYAVDKTKLERRYDTIETVFGDVVLKSAYLNGDKVNEKLEYENCKKIARENNIPIKQVYKLIEREIWNREDME